MVLLTPHLDWSSDGTGGPGSSPNREHRPGKETTARRLFCNTFHRRASQNPFSQLLCSFSCTDTPTFSSPLTQWLNHVKVSIYPWPHPKKFSPERGRSLSKALRRWRQCAYLRGEKEDRRKQNNFSGLKNVIWFPPLEGLPIVPLPPSSTVPPPGPRVEQREDGTGTGLTETKGKKWPKEWLTGILERFFSLLEKIKN